MIGHLGARVSALLDGQLSAAEAERAWNHVYACHVCRDAVEREGWIKTRLAGLSAGAPGAAAPDRLKGSLLGPAPFPTSASGSLRPRRIGLVVLGGSAAGVAVLGVLALGMGSSEAPVPDRRAPVTNLGGADLQQPVRVPGPVLRPASPRPSR